MFLVSIFMMVLIVLLSICDNVSGVSASDASDPKRFLLPFIISKLANEAKSFFYNNDIKVSFIGYMEIRQKRVSLDFEGDYAISGINVFSRLF